MKKTIRKIFSVLVAVCLCTSMVPASAMAAEDLNWGSDKVSEENAPFGWKGGTNASATTDVYALLRDDNFQFSKVGPNRNFENWQAAVSETASDPLSATFGGDTSTYEYTWSLEDVNIKPDGTYEYLPHASLPTFTGPSGENATGGSGTFGTINADGTPAYGTWVSAKFGEGTEFKYSIQNADGLADECIYRYTLTIRDPNNMAVREPITAQFMVSTLGAYNNQKLYLDDDQTNPTSVEGLIYRDPASGTVPLLSSDSVSATSPVYAAMANAAAQHDPVQTITQPTQLTITNIENLPDDEPAYKLDLKVHLGIPADMENPPEQGDTVTVYRYDPKTGDVEEITGTVVQQTDRNGNPVSDANGPVLTIEFSLAGTSAVLGAFALGIPAEGGSFTVEAAATDGGTISPSGTQTFAVGSSPEFVMYAQAGYQLTGVSLERDGSPVRTVGGLSGNTFTLGAADYNMADGEAWTVTALFQEAKPTQDTYAVSASLTGEGQGTMTVLSGAAGATQYTVPMNGAIPAVGEDAIMMPALDGVYLEFNAGSGYKLKSLKINNQEYAVVGTSYFISVLTENVNIQAEYAAGLPEPSVTRTLYYEVDGGHGYINADGETSGSMTVNYGSSTTVTLLPESGAAGDYMVDKAILKVHGSTDEGTDISGQVTQNDGVTNLQIHNILEDMDLVVSYKLSDSRVNIDYQPKTGGTVSPSGNVQLANGVPQRVTVTPAAADANGEGGYVLGSITMNGASISDFLTSRNGGQSYTFKIVRADAQSAEYAKNPDGTTDKVLYINDAEAAILAKFDPKTPPAPEYLTITTEVAASGGGTITPTQRVEQGGSTAVWVFPDEGKRVQSVMLDGRNVTGTMTEDGAKLEINNIQTDHTVVVTFEDGDSPLSGKKTYTIHPSAGTGGSISPATDVKVYEGQDQVFTFFPATNYEFSKVVLNGVDVDPDNLGPNEELTATSYTMKNITADANLSVTFKKSATSGSESDSYTVDISAGQHGRVSPTGVQDVARGSNVPITIIPDTGYSVDQINVMSKQVAETGGSGINMVESMINGVYTYLDVQDDMVINVTFKQGEDPDQPSTDPNNMIVLGARNVSVDAGVVVDPQIAGMTFYKEEGTDHANVNQDLTIRVAAGYALSTVTVNGKTLNAVEVGEGTYKITIPKEEITTRMLLEITSQEQPPSTQVVDLRTITVTWSGNGTVSPSGVTKGVVRVETGESQTFYFIPDRGNRVDSVFVNDTAVTLDNYAYTIPSVTQDMKIEATFVEDPNAPEPPATALVQVRLGVGDDDKTHGFASVSEARVVVGGPLSISFKPDSGYKTRLCEGTNANGTDITDQLSNGTLHIDSVPAAGKQYYVEFTPLTQSVVYQTVTASAGSNGTISPAGTLTVVDGSNMTFTFLGDKGYTVDKVWVTRGDGDGVEVSADVDPFDCSYTVENITSKVDVWASFKKGEPDGTQIATAAITASTSEGGSVSPASQTIAMGKTATLTFMPLRGYALTGVTDNGVAVDRSKWASGTYEISNVTGPHTVYGTFTKDAESNPEANSHDVFLNVGAGGGGTISPSGVVSVPHGGSVGFSMIPDDGYKVSSITVERVGAGTDTKDVSAFKYTLFSVTSETRVTVNFAPLDPGESIQLPEFYDIQASASMDGAISPSGTIKVAEGGMALFSFQPNDGYRLSYLVVDDNYVPTSEIVRGQYQFVGVTENHTIHAVFVPADEEAADFVTVNAGIPSGGTITPSGAKLVMKGTDAKYTVSAFYGYTLSDIRVNGTSIFPDAADGTKNTASFNNTAMSWSSSTLTLKNVQEDTSITAIFTQTTTSPEDPAVEYSRITVYNNGHGTVSYNTGTTVIEAMKDGKTLDVSLIPDAGYAIGSLSVKAANGEDLDLTDATDPSVASQLKDIWRKGYITLTAGQVNYDVTISVSFREQTEQEKQEVENGTFTPAGYRTISAQAFGRGTITPHGAVKVAQNASVTFSLIPMEGYELSGLHLDGNDVLGMLRDGRTYTLSPGTKDQTLEATFSLLASPDQGVTYKVKTAIDGQDGAKGFASVDEIEVAAGGSVTLYFWPEARDTNAGIQGSKLTALSVVTRDNDGNVVEDLNFGYNLPEYVLADVTGDTTVTAHFEPLGPDETTWTVTEAYVEGSVSADGGGRISPASATVPKGCQQTFMIFPDAGYEVSFLRVNEEIVYVDADIRSYSMLVDSTDPSNPNTFEVTFKNASAEVGDVTVTATVKASVSTSVGATGGTADIWPPERTVPAGTPVSFYIRPQEGYTINWVRVDDKDIPYEGVSNADSTYTDYNNGWPLARTTGAAGEETDASQGGLYTGGATVAPALYTGGAEIVQMAEGDTFYSVYRITVPATNRDVTAVVDLREITETHFTYVDTPVHELVVESDGGGTVSPIGRGFLATGEAENIRLRTFTGYYLEYVRATYADGTVVDLTRQVSGNNLRFVMGSQDVKLLAKFTPVGEVSFVHFELGSAEFLGNDLNALGQVTTDPQLSVNGVPTDFVRDTDGTGMGQLIGFITSEKGPNGRDLVLSEVYVNGERIPLTYPASSYVRIPTTAGGKIDVVFRELEEGEVAVVPEFFTVEGEVTSGQGEISGSGQPLHVSAGANEKIGFKPAEGWMLDTENCFDWYAEDGSDKMTPHKIKAEDLANGYYLIKGIDRDHRITVAFVQYVDVELGWTNGDHGFVTPNTMNGDPIKRPVGESLSYIVAPYEGYDVLNVKETMGSVETDVTGKLVQSAATTQQLLAMPGHENFTVKNFQEGMGVTAPVRSAEGVNTQSLEPVVQAQNEANGVMYAAAPDSPTSAAPALESFNYAYGASTAPITNNTKVMATWTEEENVKKPELRTITVEVVGNMGGTVTPNPGTGYDGEYITFNFIPEDGWAVRYIEVSRGGVVERYESDSAGGKEEYAYGPIEGDGYIKVGFDSIAHPGANDTLSRMLRTLKALAQTGDLTAPVIGTLLGIAVLASIMALVTARRRKKATGKHA